MPRAIASMTSIIKVQTSITVMRSPPFGVDRPAYGEYYTIIRQGCKLKNPPALTVGGWVWYNKSCKGGSHWHGRSSQNPSLELVETPLLTELEKSARLTRENLRDIIKAKKVAARCNGRSPPIIVIVEERPRYYLGCGYFFNVRFKTPKTTVVIKVRSA